jgi:hypothetical protein
MYYFYFDKKKKKEIFFENQNCAAGAFKTKSSARRAGLWSSLFYSRSRELDGDDTQK